MIFNRQMFHLDFDTDWEANVLTRCKVEETKPVEFLVWFVVNADYRLVLCV